MARKLYTTALGTGVKGLKVLAANCAGHLANSYATFKKP